ncbi:DUF3558 domain-containing protein [Amycolatopsis marina]|uniref:DUF3558 domain-containing protein n=1 Tax=Amycolatopsis marina TaxID=490629 RepID=UPI000B820C9C|nr:DUF3558 domain-containing protein [Amycolatopsis marina]
MRLTRVSLSLLVAGVCFALVGACSGEEPGTPTVRQSTAGADAGGSVPRVGVPLDISTYLENPCSLVPQDFVASLGFPKEGRPDTGKDSSSAELAGPGCVWTVPDSIKGLDVNVQTGNQKNGLGGLQGLYDAYQRGQFSFWEPFSVSSYPAAYHDASDLRDSGVCNLAVGIKDDLTFSVTAAGYDKEPDQACPDAVRVAEQVIATLKGGS